MTTPAPYRPKPEMMWRIDSLVEAVRVRPGWKEFHRQCGRHDLAFDHIERDGKRGLFRCVAFTGVMSRGYYVITKVAEGAGKMPLDAVVDAYLKARMPVADAEMAVLRGTQAIAPTEDFDELLGDEPAAIDIEDLIG